MQYTFPNKRNIVLNEFAIDGHDGAAKTPIAKRVSSRLQKIGYNAEVFEPFIEVNRHLGENIYPYWKENPKFAMELMSLALDKSVSSDLDIVIYDRHWLSIVVQLLGTAFERQWEKFVPTFYMQAPIEKTISCDRFSWDIPWTSSRKQLQNWIDSYNIASKRYSGHILGTYVVSTREQPLEPIEHDIIQKNIALLTLEIMLPLVQEIQTQAEKFAMLFSQVSEEDCQKKDDSFHLGKDIYSRFTRVSNWLGKTSSFLVPTGYRWKKR